jgi:hypothetical protein
MKAYVITTGAVFGLLTLAHNLACHRGKAASGEGTFVRSHHRSLRSSLPLGCALGLARPQMIDLKMTV